MAQMIETGAFYQVIEYVLDPAKYPNRLIVENLEFVRIYVDIFKSTANLDNVYLAIGDSNFLSANLIGSGIAILGALEKRCPIIRTVRIKWDPSEDGKTLRVIYSKRVDLDIRAPPIITTVTSVLSGVGLNAFDVVTKTASISAPDNILGLWLDDDSGYPLSFVSVECSDLCGIVYYYSDDGVNFHELVNTNGEMIRDVFKPEGFIKRFNRMLYTPFKYFMVVVDTSGIDITISLMRAR